MTTRTELLATARQLRETAAALEKAAADKPAHVGNYFNDLFPEYGGDLSGDYADFPVSSVCGVRCVEIMHRAKALLEICDPLCAHDILKATEHAMAIVCFG